MEMRWRHGKMFALVAALAAACSSADKRVEEQLDADSQGVERKDAGQRWIAQDSATREIDVGAPDLDLSLTDTEGEYSRLEVVEDTGGLIEPPKGPPPHLFDCTANWDPNIPRRSPVPLDCWLDPTCGEKMVVAHRGAGGQMAVIAPENSLSSLRAAILMGVDGVELDVRDTLDGGFVLMHDSNALRTTGVDKEISNMSLQEATSLQLLAPPEKYQGDFSCDHVPSLDAALLLVADKLFVNLDCKTDRMDLLALKIAELDMLDSVVLSVSSMDKALQARAVVPTIRIQIRPDTMEEVEQGIALFEPDPDVFEVPWSLVADASPVIHALGRKVSTDAFGQDAQALFLHDLSGYQELYDQGADMLMSEYPPFVLQLLNRWEW